MAETFLASASERQVWMTKYFQEYVRQSRFMPYMSNSDINKGGVILTKFERQEEAFRTINVPFIGRLKSAGVTGAQVLDGAEEELTNFNCLVTVDWRRNAVRLPKSTTFRTEIDLLNAARDALKVWETEKLRDDIIKALAAVVVDTERHGGELRQRLDSRPAERLVRRQRRPHPVRLGQVELLADLRGRGGQRRADDEGDAWPTSRWPSAWPSWPIRASAPFGPTTPTAPSTSSPSTGARSFRDLKADFDHGRGQHPGARPRGRPAWTATRSSRTAI